MKFDDGGIYIEVKDGEERLVPWAPYKKVLESISEARDEIKNIPRGMRWLVKKAMKDMNNEEYAINSLAQMIITVEGVGGTIKWDD
jgi:hypothetical protein